ncbi:hypothetical protein HHK36_009044 [Tetracentron sinense]|uniref:GATA-type domain-containing protein n=1 Tax=Tetracentron sinense TaxID=13715 RepID=A0A835DLA6_TETSI|nr:hypothetical protein HHK36_009044 [Tetracentron sinense]
MGSLQSSHVAAQHNHTGTPLWRNGPPGKPVLCNACGSRWRTKGTLANYTPLHARAFTHLDSEGSQNSQEDKLPSKTKLNNYHIKVYNRGNLEDGELFAGYDLYSTGFEDDTSNRSSSGSAISCSESCILLGSIDGNEISGSVQSGFWDSVIPSRKRSLSRRRSMSPVERLRRDLYEILQEQESSFLSECSEEVLIFQREDPMSSAEIGHGSVLLKPPVSSTEEESVASSLLRENRVSFLNGDHMGSSRLTMQLHSSEISSSQVGKDRLIQDVGDIEELKESTAKESTAKQSSLTNESL